MSPGPHRHCDAPGPGATGAPTESNAPAAEPSTAQRWAAKAFVAIAFVEAGTWAGLLVGMYLKYVAETTERGVQVFGALHGYAFLFYVAVTITAAIMLRWRWGTIVLALLAAIPPLATIPLEIWMRRTGRLDPTVRPDRRRTSDAPSFPAG